MKNKKLYSELYHDEFLEIDIYNLYSTARGKRFIKNINDKKFTVKSSALSYRIINHWESNNLISDSRTKDNKWRKFSVVDLIWLKIINELRKFGCTLEYIKKGYSHITTLYKNILSESEYPILDLHIAKILARKQHCFIIGLPNGLIEPITTNELELNEVMDLLRNHIRINLNTILAELFPKLDIDDNYEKPFILTEKEIEVISTIRTQPFESIQIVGENGEIERINWTENMNPKTKIIDILNSGKYQKIIIQQVGGKTVNIKKTKKLKLK